MTDAMARQQGPAPLRRTGAGEPLLLLHGFALNWQSWGTVVDELAGEFDICAPTLPGHWGGPPLEGPPRLEFLVQQVERVMDEAGWATAHIAGNGLGGWLAFALAERGRARSVTAIAPAGLWRAGSGAAADLAQKFELFNRIAPLGALGRYPFQSPASRMTVLRFYSHRPELVPTELLDIALTAPAHCSRPREFLTMPGVATGITGLDKLETPATVLFCEHDRVLPRHYGEVVLDDLPYIRARTLPDVGHVPMLEAPRRVANAIRDSIHSARRADLDSLVAGLAHQESRTSAEIA